jgi:multidrug efflux pump subunit AcrB
MRIRTSDGALVPISEVARIGEGIGYATIRRKDQHRTVTVKADVDQAVANSDAVLAALDPEFAALRSQYPGVDFEMGGQARERMKSFGSLGKDAVAAVVLIFVVLAGLFRSYIQPLIVMMAIPFGVIGAILGHWVMGYPMTVLSAIGLVALSGIVVNDSLILVDFINRRVREGVAIGEAVVQAGMARLRAIILTSITTILGLAPLMLEQSFQAKFLIPMAISIAFGLAFATVLTLLLVPCLYVIVDDVRRMGAGAFRVVWTGRTTPAGTVS